MRWTSRRRSISLHPGQNVGRSKVAETSQIGMSSCMDTSSTTHMTKIMVQYGKPSRSSRAKSIWSSSGRTVMGKAIYVEECSNHECLLMQLKKLPE